MRFLHFLSVAGLCLTASLATGQVPTVLTVDNATQEGGRVSIRNSSKVGATTNDWSLYNMTGAYGNGLSFWRYYTDGTNAGPSLWLADNGNVGIGTTSPSYKLSVTGEVKITSPTQSKLLFSNQESAVFASLEYDDTNGNFNMVNPRGYPLRFLTNNTERVRIDANGNVGIGTTSPVSKLHIHGSSSNDGTGGFALDATDNGNPETYVLRINPFVVGAGRVGYQFQTKSTDGGTNVPLTFDHAGNVGIGTTSPTTSLDVNGSLLVAGGASAAGTYSVKAVGADGADRDIFLAGAAGLSNGFTVQRVSNEMRYVFNHGNVGIGTTTPTHKLAVNGTVRAKEVIVDTGWADYVFKKGYRLAPLTEVEAHIEREGHLPDIPSAAEVAERGVSMGEMQAKLLAKVEELTLHAIEQQKMLKSQQAEIMSLRAELARLSNSN